jgi:porphobilinogen synthase
MESNAFLRRTRATPGLRGLVRETRVARGDLIVPLFVKAGREERRAIASMPGQFQVSVSRAASEAKDIASRGLPAVLLFGIPESKDARGSGAWAGNGIIPQAVKAIKDAAPGLVVITDVCLCEYTDHGHCGVVKKSRGAWTIENDATVPLIAKTAAAHASAGADIVAPSGMMDGAVGAIRGALPRTPILSYAAKYASAYYGPFRDAVGSKSALGKGDKKSYQMDPRNTDEALREVALDVAEGADMVMVKPGMPYLDVVRRVKEAFAMPTYVYQVSGEYAMIKAAAERGWLDGDRAMMEALVAFKRAGADGVLTYAAIDAAKLLAAGYD